MFPTFRLIKPLAVAMVLGLALLVTGLPLVRVMHNHAPDFHQCTEGHTHHQEPNGHDHGEHCGLCLYFAHFFPSIPQLAALFSFFNKWDAYVPNFHVVGAQCVAEGVLPIQANRGPPSYKSAS